MALISVSRLIIQCTSRLTNKNGKDSSFSAVSFVAAFVSQFEVKLEVIDILSGIEGDRPESVTVDCSWGDT